ncbi:MAG: cytochrome c biogenesis protein CcsA [Planctomycetota bacterium]
MATDTFPSYTRAESKRAIKQGISYREIAHAIVSPLASLKLTVFLLVFAVIVTFVATLEQTRLDVYQVKVKHFSSVFVAIPLQTIFVPKWFSSLQNVPGNLYIPSGLTILVAMLINLTAAHLLRFKLQAKGKRLIGGIVISSIAALFTWAIIFNGPNAEGFQGEPPIPWEKMWIVLQIVMLGLGIASAAAGFLTAPEKKIERWLCFAGTATLGGALGLTMWLGEKAFIGDSAMRILWQMIQATVAALVTYVGCAILFKRKAGIVLLHLGVAGLMLNEIFVTVTNDEQRMTIFEGETAYTTIDIREVEFAILDISDDSTDKIQTIPGRYLSDGQRISRDDLPFDVQCNRYMRNSATRNIILPELNLANSGIGLEKEAIELPVNTGTDSDQRADLASAYVEIFKKGTDQSLGTYLVSQNFSEDKYDEVVVDGKEYYICLRFRTIYKPYSVELIKAQQENYVGTETPRWYSSDITLNDFENGITSNQKIYMNNPLRYGGETFYQSGMGPIGDGRNYSVFQVVTNHGWMIPYVCCMFSMVGLIAQFASSMLGFLEKNRQKKKEWKPTVNVANSSDSQDAKKGLAPSANRLTWILTFLIAGSFAYWAYSQNKKAKNAEVLNEGMKLDLLGQVPVTLNGRVLPLDSVARNSALQLSKREEMIDGFGKKRPAIRWLADTMFDATGYEDYHVFRIEDRNVISSLNLPVERMTHRDSDVRFRFTTGELIRAESDLRNLIPNPDFKDPKTWSAFEKRLASVGSQLQRLYGLKFTFGRPEASDENISQRLDQAGDVISSPYIPLVVPRQSGSEVVEATDDSKEPAWDSIMYLQDRAWIARLGERLQCQTTSELATKITADLIIPSLRERAIRAGIIQRLLSTPEFVKVLEEQNGTADPNILEQAMLKNWDNIPENFKKPLVESEAPIVDAVLKNQIPEYEKALERQIAAINKGSGNINSGDLELVQLLQKLKPAYQAKDADTFNSTLETYLSKVDQLKPVEYSKSKFQTEIHYNRFAPFYVSTVLYLVGFIFVPVAWLLAILLFATSRSGQKDLAQFVNYLKPWNRISLAIIGIALIVHIYGIVERVIISGRPPVTNLYSSVIFVSAVFVLIAMLIEKFTKLGVGNLVAAAGAYSALMWAWTMAIASGDTFTVMVAVLDTQFWLSTHVVSISIGYAMTMLAGLFGAAFLLVSLTTPVLQLSFIRKLLINSIYGVVCLGLLFSYFGTVLGGLWGDDSWGRFWGWDPKENGALMIVLWNAVILHARWGGMIKDRGLAALAVLGNVIVLWSWKGVNELGVGIHAYAGNEDADTMYIVYIGLAHCVFAAFTFLWPKNWWWSYRTPKGTVAA